MNESYMNKIKETFPVIPMQMQKERLEEVLAAAENPVEKRYVNKSVKREELLKEDSLMETIQQKLNPLRKAIGNIPSNAFPSNHPFVPNITKKSASPEIAGILSEQKKELKSRLMTYAACVNEMYKNITEYRTEIQSMIEAEEKGAAGEDMVESYLRRNLDCRILSGVILPAAYKREGAPKTAETDLLVISPKGVYVCEVKNYGKAGQTLEVQPDGHVIKRDYYGRFLDDMGSPYEQNRRHCEAVAQILSQNGLSQMPIYSVLLIGNTDVAVNNNSTYLAMDMYQFADTVKAAGTEPEFDAALTNKAFQAIQAARMGERKFPIPSVSEHYAEMEEKVSYLEELNNVQPEWAKMYAESVNEWVVASDEKWRTTKEGKKWRRATRASNFWMFMALLMFLAMPTFFVLGFVYDNTDLWFGILGSMFICVSFIGFATRLTEPWEQLAICS